MRHGPTPTPHRGQSLVTILVGLLVLLGGAAFFFYALTVKRPGNPSPEAILPAALEQAQDIECQSNLQQLRAALQMAQVEGTNPLDLRSLSLGENLLTCPLGGEAYRYNSEAVRVNCPHAGHERF